MLWRKWTVTTRHTQSRVKLFISVETVVLLQVIMKLMGLNGDVNRRVLCSAFPYYPRMRKLRYFVGCFVGVVMYGAFDGKVKLAENKSTRLPTDLFTQGIFVFHNVAY